MRRALAKRLIPLLIVLVLVIPYFAIFFTVHSRVNHSADSVLYTILCTSSTFLTGIILKKTIQFFGRLKIDSIFQILLYFIRQIIYG